MYAIAFSLLIPFLFMAFYHGVNLLKSSHCRSLALNQMAAKTLDSTVDDAKFSFLNRFSKNCGFVLKETDSGHKANFILKGTDLKINWVIESGIDYDA